jgi:hypothetical protein
VKHVPHSQVIVQWRRLRDLPSSSTSSPTPSTTPLPATTLPSAVSSRADVIGLDAEPMTLLDLSALNVIPKEVRPLEKQLPHESRKLWANVTDRPLTKEFSEATKEKVAIVQKQRDEAAERKRKGIEFIPRYFKKDYDSGIPELTAEGWKAVEEELKEVSPYCIEDAGMGTQSAPA